MPLRHFYVAQPLAVGHVVTLPDNLQHRLSKVLRLGQGAEVALFNGQHGVFTASLNDAKARSATIHSQWAAFKASPTLVLALAMPKRDAWESALRQATELGVTHLQPLKTEFAQVGKVNLARAEATLIEAAEQCERHDLPTLLPLKSLPEFLKSLTTPTAWAYERATASTSTPPRSILVGPEGRFSPAEVQLLQAHPHIQALSLGSTILRVDTAVVAGLARISVR